MFQQIHAIPARHGIDSHAARATAKPLLRFIQDKTQAQPDDATWLRMGEALNHGDPAADALVMWMREHGMAPSRVLFEQALNAGIDTLTDAPAPLRAFFAHVERAPVWLDRARLERGVLAGYISGLTGLRVLRDMGLMAGYQAGAINKTLEMTGMLEKGAARRIAETTKWRMACSAEHGLERFHDGFKDTVRVRMIHALVRKHVSALPAWDAAHYGLPINQIDMQATYLAFSVNFLLGQRILGTLLTQEEAEDVMHLWRYIGWLMGVDEQWLCDSEQAGRIALYQNLLSQAPADESSVLLGRALMDEPLQRHYVGFRWIKRHWQKQVHLSVCRLFVGKQGMRNLGLPAWVIPWYPIVFAPLNVMWHAINRALPGGRERLIQQGRRRQWHQLLIFFGADQPEILAMSRVHTSP